MLSTDQGTRLVHHIVTRPPQDSWDTPACMGDPHKKKLKKKTKKRQRRELERAIEEGSHHKSEKNKAKR